MSDRSTQDLIEDLRLLTLRDSPDLLLDVLNRLVQQANTISDLAVRFAAVKAVADAAIRLDTAMPDWLCTQPDCPHCAERTRLRAAIAAL